ncbi:MAG: YciI family protein [Steroidobacteraceae bacterium]
MSGKKALSEYLVISRGRWDEDKSPEEIQKAIDAFYEWHDQLVSDGKMKAGQRLAEASMLVTKLGVIDGPFAETKEVIGGYWFFLAGSLAEAAALAAQNPCLKCGLSYEIRPIEAQRCSAFEETNETPLSRRARA